jgi:hypothetical protein
MPFPSMPCGQAGPEMVLWLFQGWPARKTGGLRPSSTPLATPRRTPMIFCEILHLILKSTLLASPGGRVQSRQTEDGKASLTIQRARANDVGVYRVTARNRVGHMTCRSRIRLGDIPARPGRPVIPQVSCREAYVAWEAPEADGNSFIMSYKVREGRIPRSGGQC